MAVIRTLMTHFGFKVEKGKLQNLNNQLTATKGRLRVAARQSAQFRRSMINVGSAIKYAAAAFVASRFVKIFTTGYSEAIDSAAKMSKAMGINVETYQALGHVARLSGANIDDVGRSMMQLGKRARDASLGQKKQKEAFGELQIDILDANKQLKDQDILLLEVADRFKKMPDGTRKTALAMEVFGRAGAKIIPMLNEGSEGIKKYMKEAKQLGLVLSKEDVKAAEEFNDQLLRSKAAFMGLRNVIAREILPYLTELLKRFQEWYREGDNAKRLLRGLKTAALAAAAAMALIITLKTVKIFKQFVTGVRLGIGALRTFGKVSAVAAIKTLLIVAAIALILLIVEDLHAFMTGKKSVTARLFGSPEEAAKMRRVLTGIFEGLKEAWEELKPALLELWKALKPILGMLFKLAVFLLKQLFKIVAVLLSVLGPLLGEIAKLLVNVIKFVAMAIEWATDLILDMARGAIDAWNDTVDFIADAAETISDAISRVWSTTVNFITSAIDTIVKIWDKSIDGIKTAWKAVGDVVQAVANAVSRAWDVALGWVVDKIQWIVDKVLYAAEKLGIIKGGKMGVAVMGGLEAITKAIGTRPGGAQNVTNRASIGTVNVTVTGSTDMKSEEFQGAVQGGVKGAISDMIKTSFSNLRPLTT